MKDGMSRKEASRAVRVAQVSRIYRCGHRYVGIRHRCEHRHLQSDERPDVSQRGGEESRDSGRTASSLLRCDRPNDCRCGLVLRVPRPITTFCIVTSLFLPSLSSTARDRGALRHGCLHLRSRTIRASVVPSVMNLHQKSAEGKQRKSIREQKLVGGCYEIRTPGPLLEQQLVRRKSSEAILLK